MNLVGGVGETVSLAPIGDAFHDPHPVVAGFCL